MCLVKKYLLNSNVQKFISTSLRHYELSRAYQHLDTNHICNVSFNQLKQSSTFCAIKASCINPKVVMRPRLNMYNTCNYPQTNWRTIWWVLYMYSWVSILLKESALLRKKSKYKFNNLYAVYVTSGYSLPNGIASEYPNCIGDPEIF